MKLAIMQPYIYPYIGYFQLINLVDKFVIYDDVNFIKQGWINRNQVLLNDRNHLFTIPLNNASSFKLIKETSINKPAYNLWKNKFFKTLEQGYKKAPNYAQVMGLVSKTIEKDFDSISQLASDSLLQVSAYLGLNTKFVLTSAIYNNESLSAQKRVIDICVKEQAAVYINAYGGQKLYAADDFMKHNIILQFIEPLNYSYNQYTTKFTSGLSIIDVLMFNSAEDIQTMLKNYRLI